MARMLRAERDGTTEGQDLRVTENSARDGDPAGEVYDWFDARRYAEAAARFSELVEVSPDSDYARFGLGLTRMRLGDLTAAVEQLAMATAMRPGRPEYQQALREARATIRAREERRPR